VFVNDKLAFVFFRQNKLVRLSPGKLAKCLPLSSWLVNRLECLYRANRLESLALANSLRCFFFLCQVGYSVWLVRLG